jgi:hypothetical protein
MFEDIIQTKVGDCLKLYVSKVAVPNTSGWWSDSFIHVVQTLSLSTVRMHARDFYVIEVQISSDSQHVDIIAGNTSMPLLRRQFDANDGFTISFEGVQKFDGTPFTIPISWCRFITSAYNLIFFGPAKTSSHVFTYVFHRKRNPDAIRQTFCVLANETIGDYVLVYSLYTAYLSRLVVVSGRTVRDLHNNPDSLCSFHNNLPESREFFSEFDRYCKECLDGVVDGWKDYSSPLIDIEMFHKWVDQAEKCFPMLWAHLCNLREVYGGRGKTKRIIRAVGPRRRQVFISMLAHKRMQNPRSLQHWALILSIAFKSVGVGSSALSVTNYFGIVVSSSKRNSFIKELYEGIQQRQVNLLSKENFIIFVVDNFQRGQHLVEGGTVSRLDENGLRTRRRQCIWERCCRVHGDHVMAVLLRKNSGGHSSGL